MQASLFCHIDEKHEYIRHSTLGRTKRGDGGGGAIKLIQLFLDFSNTILYLHLPFSVAVRISLIRHKFTEKRFTRYDVISERWSSNFSIKIRVLHLF